MKLTQKDVDSYSKTRASGFTAQVENGITEIGRHAFANAKGVKRLILPDTLRKISKGAFEGCIQLDEVYIPDGVTVIEADAFRGCTNLSKIRLPQSLKKLGDGVFSDCTGLRSVRVCGDMAGIGAETFKNCTELRNVEFSGNIGKIGNGAFSGCSNLRKISMPSKLNSIGKYAFDKCGCLVNVIMPDSVKVVGDGAFRNCTSMRYARMPKNLKIVNSGVFQNCRRLKIAELPRGIKKVSDYAFEKCTALENVYLAEDLCCNADMPETTLKVDFDSIKVRNVKFEQGEVPEKRIIKKSKNIFSCCMAIPGRKQPINRCKGLPESFMQEFKEVNVQKSAFLGCDKLVSGRTDNKITEKNGYLVDTKTNSREHPFVRVRKHRSSDIFLSADPEMIAAMNKAGNAAILSSGLNKEGSDIFLSADPEMLMEIKRKEQEESECGYLPKQQSSCLKAEHSDIFLSADPLYTTSLDPIGVKADLVGEGSIFASSEMFSSDRAKSSRLESSSGKNISMRLTDGTLSENLANGVDCHYIDDCEYTSESFTDDNYPEISNKNKLSINSIASKFSEASDLEFNNLSNEVSELWAKACTVRTGKRIKADDESKALIMQEADESDNIQIIGRSKITRLESIRSISKSSSPEPVDDSIDSVNENETLHIEKPNVVQMYATPVPMSSRIKEVDVRAVLFEAMNINRTENTAEGYAVKTENTYASASKRVYAEQADSECCSTESTCEISKSEDIKNTGTVAAKKIDTKAMYKSAHEINISRLSDEDTRVSKSLVFGETTETSEILSECSIEEFAKIAIVNSNGIVMLPKIADITASVCSESNDILAEAQGKAEQCLSSIQAFDYSDSSLEATYAASDKKSANSNDVNILNIANFGFASDASLSDKDVNEECQRERVRNQDIPDGDATSRGIVLKPIEIADLSVSKDENGIKKYNIFDSFTDQMEDNKRDLAQCESKVRTEDIMDLYYREISDKKKTYNRGFDRITPIEIISTDYNKNIVSPLFEEVTRFEKNMEISRERIDFSELRPCSREVDLNLTRPNSSDTSRTAILDNTSLFS